jgi:hypothetical protein
MMDFARTLLLGVAIGLLVGYCVDARWQLPLAALAILPGSIYTAVRKINQRS